MSGEQDYARLMARFEEFLVRYAENRASDRTLVDLDKTLRDRALQLAEKQAASNYDHLNDLRKEVIEDRARYLSLETFNARLGEHGTKVNQLEKDYNARMGQLEKFMWMGMGALTLLSFMLKFWRNG